MKTIFIIFICCCFFTISSHSQNSSNINSLKLLILASDSTAVPNAVIHLLELNQKMNTDVQGQCTFTNILPGLNHFTIVASNYASSYHSIDIKENIVHTEIIVLYSTKEQLDEVVIEGSYNTNTNLSLPTLISTISNKMIEQNSIYQSNELTALVPNYFSANPGDDRNINTIRGITSTSYDPAIATYIDGVNQFNLDTYISSLFEVEKIEFLRGPQGTTYGRNGMGGIINIKTKYPTNKTKLFIENTYGNYNLKKVSAGIKTPVVNDKLYLGGAAILESRDGYYTNQFTGRTYDNKENLTTNLFINYHLNKKSRIDVNAKYSDTKNHGAFPLNIFTNYKDAYDFGHNVNQNALTTMLDKTANISLAVHYVSRNFKLISQTSYQFNRRIYNKPIDADFSPLDGMSIKNDYDKFNLSNVLTQEIRFSSNYPVAKKLKWNAGLYGYYYNSPFKQSSLFGNDATLLGAEANTLFTVQAYNVNSGLSLYGDLTYSIKNNIEMQVGLRGEMENKYLQTDGKYTITVPEEQTFTTFSDSSTNATFLIVLPRFAFLYKLNRTNTLFLTFNRGYKSGGITQLSSDPSSPPLRIYRPEFSNQFEIGSKSQLFNNKLHLQTSIFSSIIQDVQIPQLILNDGIIITTNNGAITNYGIDIELKTILVKDFNLTASLGAIKSTFNKLELEDGSIIRDYSNNSQVFTPNFTSAIILDYHKKIHPTQPITIGASVIWKAIGKHYFDLKNEIQQSSYSLLSTSISLSYKDYKILLWIKNLTNAKYISYAYDFGAINLGNPRTIGITVRAEI